MATTYQVILKGQLFGNVETRNMFVWNDSGPNNNDSQFCTSVQAKISAMWANVGSWINNAYWDSYALEVKKWNGESWVPIYETQYSLASVTGTQGDCIGYQPSVLVRMTTSAFKVAGRKFLAGFIEGATNEGMLVAQVLAAVAEYIIEWMTPIPLNLGQEAWAGVMNKNNAFCAFTGGAVGTILSELRRRKPGYGI